MPSRRQVLAAGGFALASSGGCLGDSVSDVGGGTGDTATRTTDEPRTTDATTSADANAFRIAVTDGDSEVELVTGADVSSVGAVEQARTGGYQVLLTFTDDGTTALADELERVGAFENRDDHRLRTYFDGEMLTESKLAPGLARKIESGEWDGTLLLRVTERETADAVKEALTGS